MESALQTASGLGVGATEKGAVVETNTRLRFASWKQFFTNGAPGTHARRTLGTHARRMHGTRTAR